MSCIDCGLLASKRARVESMAALFRSGLTMQQIGDQFKVTRERVRQLLSEIGVTRIEGGAHRKSQARSASRCIARDRRYISLHGLLFDEYKALIANRATYAYTQQRANAAIRCIAWEFKNISEWWAVWEQSGHWHKRGRGIGKYAMSRPGDVGPYSPGNVKIILATDNSSEAIKRTIANGSLAHAFKPGGGIGFSYTPNKSRIRPFQVHARGRHVGQFDNALDARAAYLRACRETTA